MGIFYRSYGIVYKARHKETGTVVAMKKFKDTEDDDQVRKTAMREVRILKVWLGEALGIPWLELDVNV